jgi:hypothetical protein
MFQAGSAGDASAVDPDARLLTARHRRRVAAAPTRDCATALQASAHSPRASRTAPPPAGARGLNSGARTSFNIQEQ